MCSWACKQIIANKLGRQPSLLPVIIIFLQVWKEKLSWTGCFTSLASLSFQRIKQMSPTSVNWLSFHSSFAFHIKQCSHVEVSWKTIYVHHMMSFLTCWSKLQNMFKHNSNLWSRSNIKLDHPQTSRQSLAANSYELVLNHLLTTNLLAINSYQLLITAISWLWTNSYISWKSFWLWLPNQLLAVS